MSRWQAVTSICQGNKVKKFTDLAGKYFCVFCGPILKSYLKSLGQIKIITAFGDLRSVKRHIFYHTTDLVHFTPANTE